MLAAACGSRPQRAAATESPAPPAAGALDDAGYFAIADTLQRRLDPLWDPQLKRYDPGPGATTTEVNADLLIVHSLAALRGHDGPSRNDARARAIVRLLTGPEIYGAKPARGVDPRFTGPGWAAAPGRAQRHQVFDAEAVDGLVHAYVARHALGLDAAAVARIRAEIHAVATGPDYRWPGIALNQFNWYVGMFAADAIVNGERHALARGLRRHLTRFFAHATGHGRASGNFGAGLRFHYLPHFSHYAGTNLDSPEYANIVLSFARHYGLAREAGMPKPHRLGLLRAWVRRALAGYWTHSGYLNWDTGLGFGRWHQRKKVPLAQLALIGLAGQPELLPGRAWGAWAKWMLDQGLRNYTAIVERRGRIPTGLAYGVNVIPQSRGCAYLAASRTAANAMRALEAGLGRAPAARPPALYSYDPDTGRLAVTTPSYNTAIVAVNQHAFPYGGLDIARLFDSRQEVAANIGGTGRDAFGLTVRRGGATLLRTQYGGRSYEDGVTPLRLTRAPRGTAATAASATLRAYAAPFRDLRVQGAVSRRGVRATAAYRFTPAAIVGRWTLRSRTPVAGTVTFPSWGGAAEIRATLRDGRTVTLGPRRVALARIRSLEVVSARSGYRVTPLSRLAGATVRTLATRRQSSDPKPGPTLAVALRRGRGGAFAARIEVR